MPDPTQQSGAKGAAAYLQDLADASTNYQTAAQNKFFQVANRTTSTPQQVAVAAGQLGIDLAAAAQILASIGKTQDFIEKTLQKASS